MGCRTSKVFRLDLVKPIPFLSIANLIIIVTAIFYFVYDYSHRRLYRRIIVSLITLSWYFGISLRRISDIIDEIVVP